MSLKSLVNLGALVRDKRGDRKLRETAEEIGITAPTLMRIEAGNHPDLNTFAKVCQWLEIDPGEVLGIRLPQRGSRRADVEMHLKASKTLSNETLDALKEMIRHIVDNDPAIEEIQDDADL